jgi:tetratricopeptide (TPR) repeat protein
MGEVHEAQDLELRERVALKTLLPQGAQDAHLLERFRREIQLARRVTHPNVCRVFDLARHVNPDGGDEVTFLTMELLDGPTLAQRIRQDGPLAQDEVTPILEQMVLALESAHRAGVVHRDFKSANVMLVPQADGTTRVVVTDFGLAHGRVGDQALTRNVVVGTPGYMAPEQVNGAEAAPAMDIYALGCVLFEMVTGQRPFASENAFLEASRRLHEPPPRPRTLAKGLDARAEEVILRCLALEPGDRFVSAAGVVAAWTAPPPEAPPPRRAGWFLVAVAALGALLGVAGVTAWAVRGRGVQVAPLRHRVVALLGFRNLTGKPENAWLSTALSEMLSTELSGAPSLSVVPGEDVARMKRDLGLGEVDTLSRDTLAKVGRHLGTDLVVVGSYLILPQREGRPRIRVDVKLQDAAGGEPLLAVDEAGTDDELIALVERAGNRLRKRLEVRRDHPAPGGQDTLPHNARAAQLYTEGLDRLRALDPLQACELLQKAAELEGDHPLIHRELSNAWRDLGYDEMARNEARRAFELAGRLPHREQLLVEARHRLLQRDWEAGLRLSREALALEPDSVDLALRLAQAERSAHRLQDSLKTLDGLKGITAGSRDPQVDIEESRTTEQMGDFKRMLAAAQRAEEKAAKSGARLQRAHAQLLQSRALTNLGEPDAAIQAAVVSRKAFEDAGDSKGASSAINAHANVLLGQGRLQDARAMYEQALKLAVATGNREGQANVLINLGLILSQQGNAAESARMGAQALRIAEELKDPSVMAVALSSAAGSQMTQGDLAGARANYEKALALDRELGNTFAVAVGSSNLAGILFTQGMLARAARAYAEAQGIYEQLGNPSAGAYAMAARADVLTYQGHFDDARTLYEKVLQAREQLGELGTAAQTRAAMAVLEGWRDRHEQAEKLLEQAIPVFQKENMVEDLVYARVALAEALINRGQVAEARRHLDGAGILARQKLQNPSAELGLDLAVALLKAVQGKHAEAHKMVERDVVKARERGAVLTSAEARLRLLEIEALKERPAVIRARAARLRDELRKADMGAYAARIEARWLKPG